MSIASRVRRIYERRPYPPPSLRADESHWTLPALEWISAMRGKLAPIDPERVLVAGCGVGTEAFVIARKFPHAQIVGVDFSERSIATARKLQRNEKGGDRVRFDVADLASPRLPEIAGSRFDFISCHGVLSYIPDTAAVLRNFARCLARDGILMLGVNGAAHPSGRWRPLFSGFGLDPDEFREGSGVRDVLRVFESLTMYPAIAIADKDAGYLAGDIFGPLNRSLSLTEWTILCEEAGLHLLSTYHTFFATRALMNRDLISAVIPRSRAEVAVLVDALQPTSFHQIILSRRPPAPAPWMDASKLLRCRPMRTRLYSIRWPPRGRGLSHGLASVTLRSRSTKTSVSLRIPRWEVEILRRIDGERSLRELLRTVRAKVPAKGLREAMYLLYQLGAVNLLPRDT
jgi:SAM-dependent methyltransferase